MRVAGIPNIIEERKVIYAEIIDNESKMIFSNILNFTFIFHDLLHFSQ